MRKLKFLKTLLVAATLLMGGSNAWADPIETVGESDCSTTDLSASSTPITLNNGKFIHYVFSQNRTDGGAWNNMNGYHLIANDGSSDIIIMRPDAWENKANSGDGFTTSWSDWDAWLADMDGSTVDMYVSLNGTSFSMTATITGKSEAVYTYTYNKTLGSEPASLDIRLSVHYAYLQITTADLSNTITYDVDAFSAVGNLTLAGTRVAREKTTDMFLPTNCAGLMDRVAFQNNDTWNINASGLSNTATGKGRHFAILNLLANDRLTIIYAGGTLKTRNVGAFASLDDYTVIISGQQYAVSAGLAMFELKSGARVSEIRVNTTATETVTAPSIDSEADGSERKVTITAGASNLYSAVTTYYTTDGSDPDENATEYTAPFNVAASCTVKAITISNSSKATESTITSQYIDMDAVDVPTAAITAVDGINRTVTFSCTTEGATLSYSTDNGANYTAGTSLVISANTNIKVKATKGLASAESENMAFEAGTEIVLNTPAWTKTGYSEGVSTVTLADNQSDKLLNPASTIKYQINDGEEQTYSAAISVNDGETLKYWSVATGYTDSPKGSVVANAPSADPIYLNETYNGSDAGITVNTEEVVTTIGGGSTPYYYMYANAAHVSDNLITSTTGASNWMLRSTGIYAGNTINYALRNVQKNDIVTVTVVWGNEQPTPTATDGTLDVWNSTAGSKYVFKVTSTMGNFRFSLGRYASVKSITVQRALATPGATVGSTGYATFAADVDLDLSTLTSGFKAYFASAASNGKVTMTKATNEKIAAGEGLFIEGSGAFTITETRDDTDDVDNYLVAGNGVTGGIVKESGFDKYVLAADGESVSFFLINATPATVATNKAYLKVPSSGGSARLAIVFDNDPTGISTIENNSKDMNGYYNLNGQRVAQPAKGLYIVNGKKVIMK